MRNIIARTYFGARDLYHGVPNLKDAVIVNVIPEKDSEEYRTTLVLQDTKGNKHQITIVQNY